MFVVATLVRAEDVAAVGGRAAVTSPKKSPGCSGCCVAVVVIVVVVIVPVGVVVVVVMVMVAVVEAPSCDVG